jgi:hypothetical protein
VAPPSLSERMKSVVPKCATALIDFVLLISKHRMKNIIMILALKRVAWPPPPEENGDAPQEAPVRQVHRTKITQTIMIYNVFFF